MMKKQTPPQGRFKDKTDQRPGSKPYKGQGNKAYQGRGKNPDKEQDQRPAGKADQRPKDQAYPSEGGNPYQEQTDRPYKKRYDKPDKEHFEQSKAPEETAAEKTAVICGKNAVLEVLRSGQEVNRVLLAENMNPGFIASVIEMCNKRGIPYRKVAKAQLEKIAGEDNRGVVCELAAFKYAEIDDMLSLAAAKKEDPLLVILDGIEDPHNLGAIIRTALCAGAHGIIVPKRRSAALTATVVKTSAGAAAYLPVARVANLAQTAEMLKKAGLWLIAADMDGKSLWQCDLKGPAALVLGSEGGGIAPLLKSKCDLVAAIPLKGELNSLNVSNAAAVVLYEIVRQRGL